MPTPITITGNATADPELRFTPSGAAVANFQVAVNHRKFNKDTNEWEDAGSDFYSVSVWKQQAENVAQSIQKGMRVVVTGNLKSRQYETREGEKRTVWEIEADEVAPSLKYAEAQVRRTEQNPAGGRGQGPSWGGRQGGQQRQQQGGWGQQGNDPWAGPNQQVAPF